MKGGSFYEPTIADAYTDSIFVKSLPSRIAGRLVDASNKSVTGTSSLGISGSYVSVVLKTDTNKEVGHAYTDSQGYFEILTDDPVHFKSNLINIKNSFDFILKLTAFGYHVRADSVTKSTTIEGTMSLQGQQFSKVILMDPNGLLKGNVYTTDNFTTKGIQPVKSYIQRMDGTVVTTDDKGNFSIPIPDNAQTKLTIIPVDAGYFTENPYSYDGRYC